MGWGLKLGMIKSAVVVGLLAGVCVMGGCPKANPVATLETKRPFEPTAATGPAEATYTLRGRISALPNPPKSALVIHHEELPDFADADGNKIGMDEMEMQFPFLGAGVSLDGLAPGDLVEAVMEMRYKGQPRFLITSIKELPADTVLKLGTIQTDK
jgi:hypothetical protein